MSARLRLTLSYAGFLLVAGAAMLGAVYLVARYVPDYPLTAANPRDAGDTVASRQEILDAIVRYGALVLAGFAVVGLAGGWLLAGWILRPLRDITAATEQAAQGRLGHRIHLTGRTDEFGLLADRFDEMLERLDEAFAVQERFAANAAHELRTPLAVTRTLLDVAEREPDGPERDRLLERLRMTNDRAVALTESLLRLSDAGAVGAASGPIDLAAIAADAVDESRPLARQRDLVVDADLAAAPATGDAALLGRLAANLVQNAVRHNTAGGRVDVATGRDDATAWLRVSNTGDPYTPQEAARLSEPFLRGRGRTAGDGYGLGLALADRIARVHDGALEIAPRDGGGLDVRVAIPIRCA
ncbi:MAG TPA: HAMP domain-containing sensor histidine kinase [Capillimicrobium sp.]|nr:HAMP domain-containing sensor histidine kinase [Capillimicrobium sp.]